ncbi:MAG: hypothetical protein WBR15_09435 [Gammaproteobacteria bacterium]
MKQTAKAIVIATGLAILTGCASLPRWQTVSEPAYMNNDQGYTVNLPKGWIKIANKDGSHLELSRNGVPLNVIVIYRSDGAKAFPATKKSACLSSDMLPADLAADFIAEAKDVQHTDTLQVLKNEPAAISGKEGFHLNMVFSTRDGVRYRFEAYGACSNGGFYALLYRAPEIYYFDKDLPAFNLMVASFKIASTSGR